MVREPGRLITARLPVAAIGDWAATLTAAQAARVAELMERLVAARPPIAGIDPSTPRIMGVINVTPDSFSDGGDHADAEAAIAHGRALAKAGADILDVGGESTRPGADPVDAEHECARVILVIRALAADGFTVSIDSRRATVMAAGIEAGARLVNDVSALSFDPRAMATVAAAGVPVVLMHARGDPKTMQKDPVYDHAPLDVHDTLEARIAACVAAGIDRDRVIVDPGIDFGKTLAHNLEILDQLALYHGLGCPLLLGVSRKSFIGRIAHVAEAKARLPGSLAAGLAGLARGVQILRVHDVAETAQAVAVWRAIAS